MTCQYSGRVKPSADVQPRYSLALVMLHILTVTIRTITYHWCLHFPALLPIGSWDHAQNNKNSLVVPHYNSCTSHQCQMRETGLFRILFFRSGRGLANPHAFKTVCGDVLIITSYDCACFILPSVLFPAKKDPSSKASRHLNCTRICNSHTTQGIQSSPQLTPPSNGSGNHEKETTTVSPI